MPKPQVRRFACIYAALDAVQETCGEHLFAALAVWEYVERSVAFIFFRDNTGNPDADRILAALLTSESGLTRTMISELFGRHLSTERIDQALGLASKHERKTGGLAGAALVRQAEALTFLSYFALLECANGTLS